MQADELRSDNRAAKADADVDPTDGRDESLNERMDRNWNEILQELRVTQTGTQIFTGFLLTIAFQARFSRAHHIPDSDLSRTGRCRGSHYRTRPGARKPAPWPVPQGRKDDRRADRARHRTDRASGCRGHARRHRAVDLRSGRRSDCGAGHGQCDAARGDRHCAHFR